ncbi:MAG: SGNH/GDSL hydrolase family protein [Hyphomicrobium sp.]
MTSQRHPFRSLLAAAVIALASVLALYTSGAGTSSAAEDESVAGFLNPFPDGDVYQLSVIGDTFAEGVLYGLVDAMGADTRLNIQRKALAFWAIMSGDFESKVKAFEEAVASQPMTIAIVMMGEDDRVSFRNAEGRRVPIASPDWVAEYTRRLDRVMKALKRTNAGVYWVGLPNLSRIEANEQAQVMNETIRERAYLNGFKYIDAAAGFSDESGGYSPYGPDLAGKIRVLREPDGVHFTEAGNRKLAHFVEKELRRDLNQAKSNRNVPLLGAEAEQAKINPDNAVKTPAPSSPVADAASSAAVPEVKGATANGTTASAAANASGDQKADNSKITLKTVGANGREETASIEIVRPAIPASVIALMARRDSAGQAGDLLVDQIAGGFTLMTSIAPTSNQAKGKQSPTQAPYFRLLVKGERLQPKPGRADDFSWPAKADTSSGALSAPSAPKG